VLWKLKIWWRGWQVGLSDFHDMAPPCQAGRVGGRGVVLRDDRSKTRSVAIAPRHRAFLDQVYISVEAAVRDKQLGRRPSPSRRHPWGVAGKPASPELVGLFATAILDEIGGKTEVHTVPGPPDVQSALATTGMIGSI
jgi:hypothetical protein